MNRDAPVDHPINALLQQRHSPYGFDPERAVSGDDLSAIFEAARWSMSSYNAQPWRYIVGVKSSDRALWDRLLNVLVPGNQAWADNAPVLALGIVEHNFEHNGKPNKAASHDLGAASAMLTVEASARGLCVHQMVGIEVEAAREEFGIDGSLEPFTGLAIGYPGDPGNLDEKLVDRDRAPRQRKPMDDLIITGGW